MQEVDLVESETKCVKNFQIELDMLIQEKLAHLEELRQIQSDIMTVRNKRFLKNPIISQKTIIFFPNLKVEKTIRHSEEEKKRALESAKQLHSEYKPLKDHLSSLRESIGLEESNNDNENDEHMLIESFLRFV